MDIKRYPNGLMPRPRVPKNNKSKKRRGFPVVSLLLAVVVVSAGVLSLPLALAVDVKLAENTPAINQPFPLTVDPATKTIRNDPTLEALLVNPPTQLSASAGSIRGVFEWVALKVAALPVYQQLAGAAGAPNLFVSIKPGARQEQVATTFGTQLHWTTKQRAEFVKESKVLEPTLPQGSTVPGIYFASVSDPDDVAILLHDRFNSEIRANYSTSTDEQVPLEEALTIASLIQREAGGWDDMRLISGVIWNRIFAGMKLQIDATLQYAEANQAAGKTGWWPSVEPKDKYIKSAYNTYQHAGLPPAPIANPSIPAVVAALNPKKTDCLFYFHDSHGQFHCTKTYKEHVALLKKYYGQGK